MLSRELIRQCIDNSQLRLILMPTEACNFRCIYCYEDFKLGRMKPAVVKGVKALIGRRAPRLRSLTVSWFGGEPLLAVDVIEEVMSHAQRLATERDFRVWSDMATNGYTLSPERFRRLLDLGVTRFQVSFDGPRRFHDRKRVLAGGGGSFDRIWGNLLALSAQPGDMSMTIRLHVDRENHGAMREFIRDYQRAFGGDRRFSLYIRRLSRLGGANDTSLQVFECSRADEVVDDLRREASKLGCQLQPVAATEACYAARGNSWLIRADGRVNKCTVALEHPENHVGRLHEDGLLVADAIKVGHWMRGLRSGRLEELRCPMRGYAEASTAVEPGVRLRFRTRRSTAA